MTDKTKEWLGGVPWGLVAFLLVQTAGGAWWASSISSSVASLEEAITREEKERREADATHDMYIVEDREVVASINSRLNLIEHRLDTLERDMKQVKSGVAENNRLLVELVARFGASTGGDGR